MKPNQPNILFVFADQLRGSSLGHVGQEPVITPHLDGFAAQGVRFTRAVSNIPLCCPMRASMITGLHPLTHGVISNDIPLRTDVPSIAKSLKEVGYRTGYVGKWHLDTADRSVFVPPGPRRQGFDFWAACNCNHRYFESFYYRDAPDPIWIDGYEPTAQTDIAIDYVREAAESPDPFCLFLSYGPPHCPYSHVPARFREMYDADSLPLRPNVTEADREVIAGYYAHITALDWNFGRLLAALDEQGLADDTLVIFTSDHGDMLFSQNRGWKFKPWSESVNVPFIARWPGRIPAGHIETAPFGLVNTTPTLLSLCGAPIPAEMESEAYPEMLLGTDGPRPESTPIYYYFPAVVSSIPTWRGVVTERHTYARSKDEPWLLHDDNADPYQLTNLVDDPSLQPEMERLTQDWLHRLGDEFETPEQLIERLGIEVNEQGNVPYHMQPEIAAELQRRAVSRQERMRAS